MLYACSCEDEIAIEPPIRRCAEAALATVWESMVCGLHDADHWQFLEGWDPYVPGNQSQTYQQFLTLL
jgi:hypothetical protein